MKKLSRILLFLFCIHALPIIAQPGFQKMYGGVNQDRSFASVAVFDGIYLLGGTTTTGAGSCDLALLNVDLSGNVIWAKTFGGALWEEPCSMVGADRKSTRLNSSHRT